jgi:hypothetical protein
MQREQGPGLVKDSERRGCVVRLGRGLKPGRGWPAGPFIIRMEGGGEGGRAVGEGSLRRLPQLAGFG